MISYNSPQKITALDAKFEAQKIAFAPLTFHAAVAMLELGILKRIEESGREGVCIKTLATEINISTYGIGVLLDMGLSMGACWKEGDNYVLDKVGHFLCNDPLTKANLYFSKDVCYRGAEGLTASLQKEQPMGLQTFGDWQTIYPWLSQLPEQVKKSWFEFDHYYSDKSFDELLPLVFEYNPKLIYDIGGNTGKWSLRCVDFNDAVKVTIHDLPGQIAVSQKNAQASPAGDRISFREIDMLADTSTLNGSPDIVWMSQFLDCFSESQIVSILQKASAVLRGDARILILETFWDCQKYEAAAYSINATSLYFTCMANGNSRMYSFEVFEKLIAQAGLHIERKVDDIGDGHTLLVCCASPS